MSVQQLCDPRLGNPRFESRYMSLVQEEPPVPPQQGLPSLLAMPEAVSLMSVNECRMPRRVSSIRNACQSHGIKVQQELHRIALDACRPLIHHEGRAYQQREPPTNRQVSIRAATGAGETHKHYHTSRNSVKRNESHGFRSFGSVCARICTRRIKFFIPQQQEAQRSDGMEVPATSCPLGRLGTPR